MSNKTKHKAFLERVKLKRPDVTVTSEYTNSISFVNLTCQCGWKYKQRPNNLLAGTKGCPVCGNSGSRNQTTETFIHKAKQLHGNLYDYSKTIYKAAIQKVIITCNTHGDFLVTPHNHLSGKTGCPTCGKTQRWSYSEWEKVGKKSKHFTGFKLYIVRCYNVNTKESFYKIGKTYRNIGIRFYDIPYEYEVILVKEGSALFISQLEQKIHNKLKKYKYTPTKIFTGSTECFKALLKKEDIDNVNVNSN